MIVPKVQAMITAAPGQASALEGILLIEIERLQGILPADAQIYAGIHFGDELLAPTPYAKLFANSPRPFDAFLGASHRSGFEILTAAFANLGARLPSIDSSRSTMLAGSEHTILPGREDIFYTLVFRHPPAANRAEALAYWRNEHSKFASSPDPDQIMRGYRQFHGEESASQRAAMQAGVAFDDITGVVEVYCRSGEEMAERLSFPQIETLVIPDERLFIDHGRSRGAFYRMIGNA